MSKFIDLTDQVFTRLTVISYIGSRKWNCICVCGTKKAVFTMNLTTGHTKSCGCLRKEVLSTHKMTNTPEYRSWRMMKHRCSRLTGEPFKYHGSRGIKVCERWGSFDAFFEDMGPRPEGTSIDRIDNNGNYEPSNCRWASNYDQANNKRSSRFIDIDGVTRTYSQWERLSGFGRGTIRSRLKAGWSEREAVSTPIKSHKDPHRLTHCEG